MLKQDEIEQALHGKRLVFLVGAPRGGTTWLQLLLSRSPSVATAIETHMFNLYLRSMLDHWDRWRAREEKIGLNQILDADEFRELLRRVSGAVFAKIAQKKPSATVVIEKTPNHVSCSRDILDIWPESHFIHIIRDPRAVVASLRAAAATWASGWASRKISLNCERWKADVSAGRQIKSATKNYHEVLYEELSSNGPEVLMRLFASIGISTSLAECRQYIQDCNIENLKSGRLEGAPFDVGKMNKDGFRHGTVDQWRAELSSWEVALIERRVGSLMSELGYKAESRGRVTAILLAVARTAERVRGAAKWRLRAFADWL